LYFYLALVLSVAMRNKLYGFALQVCSQG